MQRYEVRLEARDGEHPSIAGQYRITTLSAPSADEARRFCEIKEFRIAAYELPADEASRLEKRNKAGQQLTRDERARLLTHRQRQPYEVVSVKQLAAKGA